MSEVGPLFLAAVLAETFEDFGDDGIANEAGQLLHDTLTRHGYELTPVKPEIPDDIKALNPFRGTDLNRLVNGIEFKHHLDEYALAPPGSLTWFLPADILPGVTAAWGIPVQRVDGLVDPHLGYRVEEA